MIWVSSSWSLVCFDWGVSYLEDCCSDSVELLKIAGRSLCSSKKCVLPWQKWKWSENHTLSCHSCLQMHGWSKKWLWSAFTHMELVWLWKDVAKVSFTKCQLPKNRLKLSKVKYRQKNINAKFRGTVLQKNTFRQEKQHMARRIIFFWILKLHTAWPRVLQFFYNSA